VWSRLRFDRIWPAVRDVASWGLGARWGNSLIESADPADPWKIQLVAMLLGLPFVFRADERRKTPEAPSLNGAEPSKPERSPGSGRIG
jgi:hypothetical protein